MNLEIKVSKLISFFESRAVPLGTQHLRNTKPWPVTFVISFHYFSDQDNL